MIAARFVVLTLILGPTVACSSHQPVSARYRTDLAGTTDLKGLIQLILRSPEQDLHFEATVLRMMDLVAGEGSRKELVALLDLSERYLAKAIEERPGRTLEDLYLNLKALWLKLDMKYRSVTTRLLEERSENFFMIPIAKRREGDCGSISALFLCMAERFGLPISLVVLPKHMHLRLQVGDKWQNFESTGPTWIGEQDAKAYLARFGGSPTALVNHPVFMRSLSRREALLAIVANETLLILALEHRFADVLDVCRLVEPVLGEDYSLLARAGARMGTAADETFTRLLDPDLAAKAMRDAERWWELIPGDSGTASLILRGYFLVLKDIPRSRETAKRILENPRMSAQVRRQAYDVLKETPSDR